MVIQTEKPSLPSNVLLLASNLKSLVTVKLEPSNYSIWRSQIQNFFEATKLFGFLVVSTHCKDVWSALEKRFTSLSHSHIYQIKNRLSTISKKSKSMETYLEEIKDLVEQLSLESSPIYNEDLVLLVLNGLPEGYSAFKTTIRAKSESSSTPWYVDSATTSYLTNDLSNVHLYQPYQGQDQVMIGDGNTLPILNSGTSVLSSLSFQFRLNKLLHVPQISPNLLYVHQLTTDNKCSITFNNESLVIQDKLTNKVLCRGHHQNDLYHFPYSFSSKSFSGTSSLASVWHKRLGHPSSDVSHSIANKSVSSHISLSSSHPPDHSGSDSATDSTSPLASASTHVSDDPSFISCPLSFSPPGINLTIPILLFSYYQTLNSHPMLTQSMTAASSKVGLIVSFLDIEPRNYKDAMHCPHWHQSMLEEFQVLQAQKTWSLISSPAHQNLLGCKWSLE
ncbi:uncharacterized protein LOC114304175 [Camellia sinensis]|uniref:uncharacterized protein LOC114304175 n=1 Tax=Camellia sinensis TaxID=4442 RepID=UPI001036992C|nr:uncharacterized protein LOC114304175 [Camellia sinensis]